MKSQLTEEQKKELCMMKYGNNRFTKEQLRAEFSEVFMRLKEGDWNDEEDKKNWEEQLDCMKMVDPTLKPLKWNMGQWEDENGKIIQPK